MYKYEDVRSRLFDDEGQRMVLRVRDFVHKTLAVAGAVRLDKAMDSAGGGDSWTMIASVDRLVELGEIREVPQSGVAGQDRIFVKA